MSGNTAKKSEKSGVRFYRPRNKGGKKTVNAVNKPIVFWKSLMAGDEPKGEKMIWLLKATEQLRNTIASQVYGNNRHEHTSLEDLKSAAKEGVMAYMDSYDGSTQPNTYFYYGILDYCSQEIHRSNGGTKHQNKVCREAREIANRLTSEGKVPTLDNIARLMGITPETLTSNLNIEASSQTENLFDEETGNMKAEVERSVMSVNPEDICLQEEQSEEILKALSQLSETDRELIRLYIMEQKTFAETSRILKEKYGRYIPRRNTAGAGFSINQISRSTKLILEKLAALGICEYLGKDLKEVKPLTKFAKEEKDEELIFEDAI